MADRHDSDEDNPVINRADQAVIGNTVAPHASEIPHKGFSVDPWIFASFQILSDPFQDQ